MSTHQPITVVGAGLGGLTLAGVLHRHGVPVSVVDLDASPTARAQGGMLDIHEESGKRRCGRPGSTRSSCGSFIPAARRCVSSTRPARYATRTTAPTGTAPRSRKAKAQLMEHFADWADEFRRLIADGPLIPRAIHALPVGHRWERVPGVTLLGDAAHLMSPFAGEGANLAMQDGAELAQALLARSAVQPAVQPEAQPAAQAAGHPDGHPEARGAALADYERRLFPRSAAAAAESAAGLEMCFGPGAPQGLVDPFHQTLD